MMVCFGLGNDKFGNIFNNSTDLSMVFLVNDYAWKHFHFYFWFMIISGW